MACGAAVLGLAVASTGNASSLADKTTHLTFTGPVGLPGVTLPRGTYAFEIISMDGRVVRVLSRDRTRLYFTGLTAIVARPRSQRADRPVALMETSRGLPPRIGTWYPLGDSTGRRFIYEDATR
jgi:hypothetical protein